ncbi:putative methyltransferase-domain-containing protein [Dipodascopsis tothii]|uniref:putative methyltransferase-domain-containing protein n=1 Tax=Dipodascopsis tothii TaxID=44089 RepID=UPI0034CE81D4
MSSTEIEEPLLALFQEDLVPVRDDVLHFADVSYASLKAGVLDVQFDGVPIAIEHDGGAAGCGGKLWPAGELLSQYLALARTDTSSIAHDGFWKRCESGAGRPLRVVELGTGTGLVGLVAGKAYKAQAPEGRDLEIYATDQACLVGLVDRNVKLNELEGIVHAAELNWGEPVPAEMQRPDVVLAADCVYLEAAFPLLEQTLLELTDTDTLVLMAYKKRRKADSRFFKAIRKHFTVVEIRDYAGAEGYQRQGVFLFQLIRRKM